MMFQALAMIANIKISVPKRMKKLLLTKGKRETTSKIKPQINKFFSVLFPMVRLLLRVFLSASGSIPIPIL